MIKSRTNEITITAIFSAIIFIMAVVPFLGFITIPLLGVSISLVHIPVLIGGVYGGKRVSIGLGLAFGLSSLFVAWTQTRGILDPVFRNPLVSVLPRVIFGIALWYLFVLFGKIFKNRGRRGVIARYGLTFGLGTFVHTMAVLPLLYVFARFDPDFVAIFGDVSLGEVNVFSFIWAILSVNGFIEMGLSALVGVPIALRLLFMRPETDKEAPGEIKT